MEPDHSRNPLLAGKSRKIRHVVAVTGANRYTDFRTGTIIKWRAGLGKIAELATQLDMGMPAHWTLHDTEELRSHIVAECPNANLGSLVQALYVFRDALTLGGLSHDPTRDFGTPRKWSGDTAASRERTTQAIPPHVFQQVVGNALTYIEKCADDIVAAGRWRDAFLALPRRKIVGNRLKLNHPVRLDHPDVTSPRLLHLHRALETIGGIPTATVPRHGRDAFTLGEHSDICLATVRTAAGLSLRGHGGLDHEFLLGRLAAGVPKVPGGLPFNRLHDHAPRRFDRAVA